jgi:MFS family permease
MRLDSATSLLMRLLVLAVLVLVPPMALIADAALDRFEQAMGPELDSKALAVGHDLSDQIERAVGLGIPIDKLVGVEEFFAPVLATNSELRYLAVTDSNGRVLFLRGADKAELEPHYRTTDFDIPEQQLKAAIGDYNDLALPIEVKGVRLGMLHVGMDAGYVHQRVTRIFVDVGVVMAVALLLASEILLFVVVANVSGPLRRARWMMERVCRGDFTRLAGVGPMDEVGRFVRALNAVVAQADDLYRRLNAYIQEIKGAHFDAGAIERAGQIEARVNFIYRFAPEGEPQQLQERHPVDVRLALVLFVFAEELSRPFLPLYIKTLPSPVGWLTPEMAMALPIAVFMACVGIATPWAGAITGRLGSRPVFLFGLVPAILGFVLAGLAHNVVDMTIWRAATGFGYAVVTMACQGYMSRAVSTESRAQGLGMFVGAVLTASVCGMALGGVLVERVGFRDVFFVSAGLAMLSGVLANRLNEPAPAESGRKPSAGDLLVLLRNWRFSVLMLFAAIPSKLALTGAVYFLVPVYLAKLGYGFGDIARVLMVYAVTVVVTSPLVARLADQTGWRAGLVALGGVIGGLGLLVPAIGPGIAPVMVAMLCLGLAQGLAASPQLAVVPDVCWIECRSLGQTNVLAQVRLLERIGSTAGPLLAAALLPLVGYAGAISVLGAVMLAMALVFLAASFAYGSGPHIQSEDAA